MSLKNAYTNLATLLTTDGGISNWLALAAPNKSFTVLKGNREVKRISPRELPALVLEMGDLTSELEVQGQVQSGKHELKCSIVWHEAKEDAAFERAIELPELVVQAVMADGGLGGSVFVAHVSKVESDYGYNHPHHSVRFTVSAEINTEKA